MQAKSLTVLTLRLPPRYGVGMAAVSTVRIYDTLKSHFGEADVRQFIEYLKAVMREARGELATKSDLAELRAAAKADLTELRATVKADLAELRTDLERKIAEAKTDMVKWMFLFWTGTWPCSSA